jgi:hypothetical protein
MMTCNVLRLHVQLTVGFGYDMHGYCLEMGLDGDVE